MTVSGAASSSSPPSRTTKFKAVCPICQRPSLVDERGLPTFRCTAGDTWWQPWPGPQTRFLSLTKCFEVLYGGAAGGGKLLRLDEPIPTPSGWTTMGELRVGDEVLDADGRPTRVTFVSAIEPNPNAWELEFDDGTRIECDAEHQWVTLSDAERAACARRDPEWQARRRARRAKRRGGKKSPTFSSTVAARNAARAEERRSSLLPVPPSRGTTKTTQQIVDTLRVGKAQRANHCIVNAGALELPRANLPIEPYTLGAWLGDGTTLGSGLTGIDPEVWQAIEADGYVVTHSAKCSQTHTIRGLVTLLKAAGLHDNKHIPISYLRASREQRVALLQGLCDTDGHATDRKGSIEFTTTRRELRDGMVELLASLGIKPSCREGRATLNGRDVSAKWRIQFWTDIPCFRIARKRARQKTDGFRGCHDRRYIVNARRVAQSPMRCIAVDAPTRTYLAGRAMVPTHNTQALLIDAVKFVGRGYGSKYRALLMRRTYPELTRGLIAASRDLYPRLGGRYNQVDHCWTFPGGEIIEFGHCQHEHDITRYQGPEYQFVGYDELTHFLESQYRYMMSRLRSSIGIPCRIRGATNPGGRGHEWVFKRFAPFLDTSDEYDGVRAESGQVLYYASVPGSADVERLCERNEPGAKGRTFIAATLEDNPALAADGEYAANLDKLDPVTRARLRRGDWLVKPAKGMYFKRAHFADRFLDLPPVDVVARYRYWDRAASVDGDYTAGVRMSRTEKGIYVVEHVARFRGAPADVVDGLQATSEADGVGTKVRLEQDPGQAGKVDVAFLIKELEGFDVRGMPKRADKITAAGPFSAQVNAGNVRIVRGSWNGAYLDELEAFPEGDYDDQVDGSSGAFSCLLSDPGRPKRKRLGGGLTTRNFDGDPIG